MACVIFKVTVKIGVGDLLVARMRRKARDGIASWAAARPTHHRIGKEQMPSESHPFRVALRLHTDTNDRVLASQLLVELLTNMKPEFEKANLQLMPMEAESTWDEYARAAVECRGGELECDSDAVVSWGDDPGAYVATWTWVTNKQIARASGGSLVCLECTNQDCPASDLVTAEEAAEHKSADTGYLCRDCSGVNHDGS